METSPTASDLYAFPVQQTLAHFGAAAWPLPVYVAVCFVVTLACAMASWRVVEAPALRLKHRRQRVDGTAGPPAVAVTIVPAPHQRGG